MNRRNFLLATAAAQARIFGANERIRVGIIGPGGRGRYLMGVFKEFGADLAGGLRRLSAESGSRAETGESQRRPLQGLSQAARQQVARRRDRLHAGPLARADGDRRGSSRQGRIRREADGAQDRRRLRHHRSGAADQARGAGRDAAAQRGDVPRRQEDHGLRPARRSPPGHLRLVQLHRQPPQGAHSTANSIGSSGRAARPKHDLDPARYFNWYYYFDYSGGLHHRAGRAHHRLHPVVHELERPAGGHVLGAEARICPASKSRTRRAS